MFGSSSATYYPVWPQWIPHVLDTMPYAHLDQYYYIAPYLLLPHLYCYIFFVIRSFMTWFWSHLVSSQIPGKVVSATTCTPFCYKNYHKGQSLVTGVSKVFRSVLTLHLCTTVKLTQRYSWELFSPRAVAARTEEER